MPSTCPCCVAQAAITRSERYGDELQFEKDASPEKKEAIEKFR
jgi:hypothetical protein